MNKTLTIIGLMLALNTYSQNPLESRIRTRVTCYDVFYNALELIPEYYTRNEVDSIYHLIDYWENKCGVSEYSQRIRSLIDIENDNFDNAKVNYIFYQNLLNYSNFISWQNLVDSVYENPELAYKSAYDEPETIFEFNSFSQILAQKISNEREYDGDTKHVLNLYKNDIDKFFTDMNSEDTASNSIIYELYNKDIAKYNRMIESDWKLLTGTWLPLHKASKLGAHPIFGFYGGGKKNKTMLGVTLLFRFGKSNNNYNVVYEDSVYNTNHFFGGYFGIEGGYEILKNKKSCVDFLAGVGFDGFDALDIEDEDDNTENNPHKSLNSLNLNSGLGYKYFFNQTTYLGLEGRYNFVNYKNKGGTDLSGNTISIRVLLGFMNNHHKTRNLERLKYYEYKE